MKSIKNIGLLIIGLLLMLAFSSCGSESPVPSSYHARPVQGNSQLYR